VAVLVAGGTDVVGFPRAMVVKGDAAGGDFDQLGGVVDVLVRLLLDGQRGALEARRFLSAFPDQAAAARSQRPAAPGGSHPNSASLGSWSMLLQFRVRRLRWPVSG
jgi:hypothetical protein